MKVARFLFEKLVSRENLFRCWDQFKRGKRKRKDVQIFERHLEDNIFQLQHDLQTLQYFHSPYSQFYITDPKLRHISKASVRDRLVHHIVYETLVPVLDRTFIFHSLSCRIGKGTHFGITALHEMIRKCSANGAKTVFALKMDVRRFFDTINHHILKTLLRKRIQDQKLLHIVDLIIDGFKLEGDRGIPLGNVTSQLFANVYLHELDDFIKQVLREKYYLRYCDDFIILSTQKDHLKSILTSIKFFLKDSLHLELHPQKVNLRKVTQGIDFVGYILFEKYALLRTRTKKRMKKRLKITYENYLIGKMDAIHLDQRLQSYLGILSHANQYHLASAMKNAYWIRSDKFAACGGISKKQNSKP
jgi:RNA-directed DNA polymerase